LQLAAAHPEHVLAVVLVDPASFVRSPEQRAGVEALAAAIEAGNQEPVRQFIVNRLFLPTSDRELAKKVLALMLAAPSDASAADVRAMLAFDGPAVAAQCKVPVLHLAAMRPFNPPHLMSQWLPAVINGWTVGAGHYSQLEAPDQVNAMIEGFLRHHV
jgi:pimeloyl-ACP methyl ester carboxylesterase